MKTFEYRGYKCYINAPYFAIIRISSRKLHTGKYNFTTTDLQELYEGACAKAKEKIDQIEHAFYTANINTNECKRTSMNRDFSFLKESAFDSNVAVCKRCHYAMTDAEPMCKGGEFYHPSVDRKGNIIDCRNAGKCFSDYDLEIVPWMNKSGRRMAKNSIRL